MKRFLFLMILTVQVFCLNAQDVPMTSYRPKFDVSGMIGWMLAGREIVNAPVYSGVVNYIMDDTKHLELSYNYLTSTQQIYIYDNNGIRVLADAPYTQGYLTGGMMKIFPLSNPDLMPFLTISIGAMHRNFSYTGYQQEWSFASGITAGVKYLLNERVGIRAQARVQAPMNGVGLGVSVGSGGVRPSIGTYSNQMQLDFSGGLFIRL
ncbi:MAG: hypothetical protein U0U66_10280 [Cytophagaceae bacterium]